MMSSNTDGNIAGGGGGESTNFGEIGIEGYCRSDNSFYPIRTDDYRSAIVCLMTMNKGG